MIPVKPASYALFALLVTGCAKPLILKDGGVSNPSAKSRTFNYTSAFNFEADFVSIFDRYFQTRPVPQLHADQRAFTKASQVENVGWDGSGVTLLANETRGSYQSAIIDAGDSVPWQSVLVKTANPVNAELPDNSILETDFVDGAADMRSNILLLHFNEGDANPIADSSAQKNVVDNLGTVSDVNGKFNGARKFSDSSDDRVRIGDLKGLTPNKVTAELWVRTNSNYTPDTGFLNIAVDGDTSNDPGDRHFLVIRRAENLTVVRDANQEATGVKVNSGKWHHVAVTWNSVASTSTKNLFVYVDGEKVHESNFKPDIIDASNPKYCIQIGEESGFESEDARRCNSTEGGRRLDGWIDEVAIYADVLSAEEIRKHYQRGASKYKLSARSCDQAICSSPFIPITTSGPKFILPGVTDNRYFQYKIELERDGATVPVRIHSVEVGPNHFFSGAHLTPATAVRYQVLDGFKEYLGPANEGTVRYQLSPNGASWYYHNGMAWLSASGNGNSSTVAEVNASIAQYAKLFGPGTLYFRAILSSPEGRKRSELESVELTGEFQN